MAVGHGSEADVGERLALEVLVVTHRAWHEEILVEVLDQVGQDVLRHAVGRLFRDELVRVVGDGTQQVVEDERLDAVHPTADTDDAGGAVARALACRIRHAASVVALTCQFQQEGHRVSHAVDGLADAGGKRLFGVITPSFDLDPDGDEVRTDGHGGGELGHEGLLVVGWVSSRRYM